MWKAGHILTNEPGDVSSARHPPSHVSSLSPLLYGDGDGDNRFAGASTFDESRKGATSILQSVIWVSPKCQVEDS